MLIKANSQYLKDDLIRSLKFFRKNPTIAARYLLRRDGEPLDLMPIQEAIINDWWFNTINVLTASRGSGKTLMSGVYTALKCLLYPSTRIGMFGSSFRQSKLMFEEFKLLCNDSPVLEECLHKQPTVGNDQAYCEFKSAGSGVRPSVIKALPIGTDGGKIRGNRFSEFFLDECAQLPETVFRSVIRPMISTEMNPAKKARLVEKLREKYGEDVPDNLLASSNGYTVITSGYYKFNYWWNEILKVWKDIKKGDNNKSLRFVPYYDLPEGFLNMEVINQSRDSDPKHVFLTEWCAQWISDSEGAFPMSLLESARSLQVEPKHSRDKVTDKGKKFIFGMDVARDRASTAIVVIELGFPSKLVFISELEDTAFTEQTKHLFDLIHRFDPFRVYMDPFGGGSTIQDLLANPESLNISVDMKVIEANASIYESGRRILVMCPPSNEFIEESNNRTKALLEQGSIKLPTSVHPIESIRKGGKSNRQIDLVEELIKQTASVVVTQTSNIGRLRYDLPKTKSTSYANLGLDSRKKDLYSAFVLASYGVYELLIKTQEERKIVQQGVIKEIDNNFQPVNNNISSGHTISDRGRIVNNNFKLNTEKKKIIPSGGIIITRNGRK